jgi:hypothetical protein
MRLANIGVSPNREKSQPNGTRLELKKTKGLMNKMRLEQSNFPKISNLAHA